MTIARTGPRLTVEQQVRFSGKGVQQTGSHAFLFRNRPLAIEVKTPDGLRKAASVFTNERFNLASDILSRGDVELKVYTLRGHSYDVKKLDGVFLLDIDRLLWVHDLKQVNIATRSIKTPVPEMKDVPGGPFLFGDDYRGETIVTLPNYRIGRYAVTMEEYFAFLAANPEHGTHELLCRLLLNPSLRRHPVVWTNLYNATSYFDWLSSETGRKFRLPTEEEWEKAARGEGFRRRRHKSS